MIGPDTISAPSSATEWTCEDPGLHRSAFGAFFKARPAIRNVFLRLHEELLDFLDFMQQTEREVTAREAWVAKIREAAEALRAAVKRGVWEGTPKRGLGAGGGGRGHST